MAQPFKAVEIATSDMSTNTLTYGIAYTSKMLLLRLR